MKIHFNMTYTQQIIQYNCISYLKRKIIKCQWIDLIIHVRNIILYTYDISENNQKYLGICTYSDDDAELDPEEVLEELLDVELCEELLLEELLPDFLDIFSVSQATVNISFCRYCPVLGHVLLLR